ncbi:hypothetical protein [Pseudomonas sp.]|uniref:hypothetical protein n=1 Tax=Pseudomonas sp. TaxID=306 RepID=UPI0026331B2B|nr:hypothetical protein [Pseudomonas sp.]
MHLFKIEGKEYLATEYKVGKDQIWKEGSGRDSDNGKWYGSILGFYTNLNITLVFKDRQEVRQFVKDTRKSAINVSYYDPETMTNISRVYYIGNYQISYKGFYDDGSDQYFDTTTIDLVVHNPD